MPSRESQYPQLWALIAQEYRTLRPRLAALRAPEENYMQIDAGGKAAHYEWKVLTSRKSHIEVALHFEADRKEENQEAIRLLEANDAAALTISGLQPFASPWSRKWTRFGVRVEYEGEPDPDIARKSAAAMKGLVERTYPIVRDLLERSAASGGFQTDRR